LTCQNRFASATIIRKKTRKKSVILNEAKRNEESILLRNNELWILHFVQNDKTRISLLEKVDTFSLLKH